LLVLEYITNPFLVLILCGFPNMKLKDSSMSILRSDVANAIHKEYIYKDISTIDFATQALAIHTFVKIHTF
jgi:hypothetical protein